MDVDNIASAALNSTVSCRHIALARLTKAAFERGRDEPDVRLDEGLGELAVPVDAPGAIDLPTGRPELDFAQPARTSADIAISAADICTRTPPNTNGRDRPARDHIATSANRADESRGA
jgi:hypothetical protein